MKGKLYKWLQTIPLFTRYIIIGLVIVFISLLFPKNIQFKYNYEIGKTWNYPDLIGRFDFPIVKSEVEYNEELQLVKSQFAPYYQVEESINTQQKEVFVDGFREKLEQAYQEDQYPDVRSNPTKYRTYGERFLNRLLNRGIIKLDDAHSNFTENSFLYILEDKRTAKKRLLRSILNEQRGEAILIDSLPAATLQEPDFLYDVLKEAIVPNLIYNDSLTQKLNQDKLDDVPRYRGMGKKGEVIISRGDVVTTELNQKLISYQEKYEQEVTKEKDGRLVYAGYLLITIFWMGMLTLYLIKFYPNIFGSLQKVIFIFFWIVAYSYLVYWANLTGLLSMYMIPFAIVPIIIKNFYDGRIALFVHVTIVLLAGFLATEGFEFVFTEIVVGVVVILANVKTRKWSQFFIAILYIFLAYISIYFAFLLIQEGTLEVIELQGAGWILLNVVFVLLAYPLIPLLERIFGFTSEITLVELSALDTPLLKELSMKAPGTFQHSLQVANLSEAAAAAIGANSLLVKVAALYHDIGKMSNAFHFIENQSGASLHNNLKPAESAEIIIGHVITGHKMAKKEGLPKVISDFILTHHGTTRVEYFYRQAMNNKAEDEEIDETEFRYPGPIPFTKEHAIMMVADSIEAAAKSMKNHSEEGINDLVEKITNYKLQMKQFDNAPLSFAELETVKSTFKKLLKSIYHVRIAYPDEKK